MLSPKFIIVALGLWLIAIGGCWDQKIIEQQNFITTVGLETTDDPGLLYTFMVSRSNVNPKQRLKVFAFQADSLAEGMERANLYTGFPLEAGKINQLLLAQTLAGRGIKSALACFTSNPNLPMQATLAVVAGSPRQFLTKLAATVEQTQPTSYLEGLLQQNAKQALLVKNSIGNFEVAESAPGVDPTLPLVKLNSNGIIFSGTALFAGDRMVGQMTPRQTVWLQAMTNRLSPTKLVLKHSPTGSKSVADVGLLIKKARGKVRLYSNGGRLKIEIILRLRGNLPEHSRGRLDDSKTQRILERNLAGQIKASCLELVHYTQRLGCDPFGFGNLWRGNDYAGSKTKSWNQIYRKADVSMGVRLEIDNYGVTF